MTDRRLAAPTKKPIRLAPVRPSVPVRDAYQAKFDALIGRMARAVQRAVLATYRRKPPEMAADESPAAALRDTIEALSSEWERRFDEFARSAGRQFAERSAAHADRSFSAGLRKAGFTVKFRMTKAANDVMQATIAEQVGLIKSIPQEYLTDVQGAVMRSVQQGRDLASLAQELEHTYGVTKRRAATIARDQNNKATASMTRVRQQELGITQAVWLHSLGGRRPRPTHLANNGKTYDVAEGWLDPAVNKRIWPGELINCRCVSRSIIPGLE